MLGIPSPENLDPRSILVMFLWVWLDIIAVAGRLFVCLLFEDVLFVICGKHSMEASAKYIMEPNMRLHGFLIINC